VTCWGFFYNPYFKKIENKLMNTHEKVALKLKSIKLETWHVPNTRTVFAVGVLPHGYTVGEGSGKALPSLKFDLNQCTSVAKENALKDAERQLYDIYALEAYESDFPVGDDRPHINKQPTGQLRGIYNTQEGDYLEYAEGSPFPPNLNAYDITVQSAVECIDDIDLSKKVWRQERYGDWQQYALSSVGVVGHSIVIKHKGEHEIGKGADYSNEIIINV